VCLRTETGVSENRALLSGRWSKRKLQKITWGTS
jgi:hypothetical protein